METISFRDAREHEAGLLGEVALLSKGYWGYSEDFLEACHAELAFRPDDLTARRFVVADSPAGIVGFYSIDDQPPSGELGNLRVVPERIGTGLGRKLWEHAVATAGKAGYTSLRIKADPNAVGFYRAMGAEQIGEAPSGSIQSRTLPLLLFRLPDV